jgi:hypothetical protein
MHWRFLRSGLLRALPTVNTGISEMVNSFIDTYQKYGYKPNYGCWLHGHGDIHDRVAEL